MAIRLFQKAFSELPLSSSWMWFTESQEIEPVTKVVIHEDKSRTSSSMNGMTFNRLEPKSWSWARPIILGYRRSLLASLHRTNKHQPAGQESSSPTHQASADGWSPYLIDNPNRYTRMETLHERTLLCRYRIQCRQYGSESDRQHRGVSQLQARKPSD